MKKIVLTALLNALLISSCVAQIDSFPSNLIVNTTVRIVGYSDTIIHGVKKWNTSTGTGFFFLFQIDTAQFECIVTNRHVVERSTFGRLRLKVFNPTEHVFAGVSKTLDIPDFNRQWIYHPQEDLAILPLKPISKQFQKQFGAEIRHVFFTPMLVPALKDSLQISSIEKVIMIGYPNGLWDSINNLPIVRQGLTATPFFSNFNGSRRFLIDIPIFPGSSGSPVMLYSFDPYFTGGDWLKAEFRSYLLGIVVESYRYDALGSLISTKTDPKTQDSLNLNSRYTTSTEIPFNLALVIKSERLNEFLPLIKTYLVATKKTLPEKSGMPKQ